MSNGASAHSALPTSKVPQTLNLDPPKPTSSTPRRRQSSEEFAASMMGPNAEPAFVPVSKGKVSDATFGMNADRLQQRNRSQDDADTMAQALGLTKSRAAPEEAQTPPGGRGTRGGKEKDSRPTRSRADRRHTLDTAPGAQGVVRHTDYITAGGAKRGHANIIESQPLRIAGKGAATMAPVPEERRLDRLEGKFLKETLAKHWLFEKFVDQQFSVLIKNCETRDLKEGQPLIVQNAEDDGRMYILYTGSLSVHVKDAAKKAGDESKKEEADRATETEPSAAINEANKANAFDRGVHVASVLSGGWVGDMALLYRTTRTATVIAESDSRVLAVPRVAYENVIAEGYEQESSTTTNEFAGVPVLSMVKDSNSLTQQGRATTWATGDVLFESGSGAREMLVITQGEVEFKATGAAGAAEYRWYQQGSFTASARLAKGDVLAGGRPGDESFLVTLHNNAVKGSSYFGDRVLRLGGGLPKGAATAVAASDGKGYRFYLQDIVTHTPLLETLTESLEGIRSLLQCTPALSAKLTTTQFDAAAFVMYPVKYPAGHTIPVYSDKSQGNPLMVLVNGKVSVRREDDVSIRNEGEPPPKAEEGKKVDEGIVGRLYDCMTSIVPESEPTVKLVAKTNVTLIAMNRNDHADLVSRTEALSAVRTYPPKRPSNKMTGIGSNPGHDGNMINLGDLTFERKIGQGAYGAVYLVVHKPSGKTLAAKIIKLARLRKHQKDDAINVERHVMQDSDNPFVVRLYGSFKTRTHLLLVMEAGLGGELFSFLLRQEHQVLREDSVRFYGACVLSGLEAMHADGYMYRDLKPENVVITADGYCKIVDFGFAKRTAARTYTVCGTNAYLSPEMLTVQGHNFEVDYWAFGVFLYEMAIGCASFNVEPDGTMNHEMPPFKVCQNILNPSYKLRFDIGVYKVSPELQDVITQLLERRVEHRIGCRSGGAKDICDHPFFAPLDFDKLKRFEYQPTWNPELQSGLDTRYFETTHKMRKSELIAFGIQDF